MGGARRSQRQMDEFREAIHQCKFKDLGYYGPDFTGCNMQEGERRMYLRLDQALATPEWIEYYKDIKVHHLVESTFDHCTLLITDATLQIQIDEDFNSKLCGPKGRNAKILLKKSGMEAKS